MQETRDVIRAFGTNHTVMLSTHLLQEVTRICHRVAIIDQGRLLAIDSPAGLQRAVAQTHVVTLRVGMPAEQPNEAARSLQAELLAVDGVEAVHVEPATNAANQLTATCQVAAKEGVEAAMARAVVPRWELHGLARQQPTLENVFLHYVSHRASTTGNAS